ncbi:ArsR/SmtB family transcription factor [Cryptosporangium sp. NPDC048952]|uniref:ArsR/SmtB family transcription factor n=1 Tax=Cryptosporangium sp. NPDC048952 TaxID=3363961 RepID=UPI003716B7C8
MPESTRELTHPAPADFVLTDVLFALSDPSRLAIVRQLADGPVETIGCQTLGGEIPKSTRSHYLKTLREAGVIRNVARGRERLISLRTDELETRFPGLLTTVLAAATDIHPADAPLTPIP